MVRETTKVQLFFNNIMTKTYTQAPLPFVGQKRRWIGYFKTALKEFVDCNVFIDLFGGSGLLSHVVHAERPEALVVYNDFDDYHKRIDNIPRTNALLADLRILLKDCPAGKLVRDPQRAAILERIKAEERRGYVDYITLSSSLLFSTNYANNYNQLEKQSMYHSIRKRDFCTDGYLDGLEIVHEDYRELFNKWKHSPNVCFLIDPPYLSTEVGSYTGYWKLKDYLDVLHTLKDTNYFYFTSNKSNIVELCDWIENDYAAANPFHGAVRKEMASKINYKSHYTDIMLYKRRKN